ncbi:MAG: DUF922 domain-containing protein [Chryseotalea sp.]
MKLRWQFGLLALMLGISFDLFSQEFCIKRDSILWSTSYRLKWSDFAGRVDSSSNWMAGCAASIYVKGFWENGLPNFSVSNSFIRGDAWTKDTTSVAMLQHEQLHFDIAEIHARKIRRAVALLRQQKVKDIEAYSAEIRKLLQMRNDTDSLYDEQTSHGTYGNQQSEWKQKILKELQALNNYAVKCHP